jgi:hypothetical protein
MSIQDKSQKDGRVRVFIVQGLFFLGFAVVSLIVELTTTLNGFNGIGMGLIMALFSGVVAFILWRKNRRR